MTTAPVRPRRPAARLFRPPLRDTRFWLVQIVVVALAMTHLALDIALPAEPSSIPAGVPVALLLAPVSYAALRHGLSGSVSTALWATLLWLPDLLLPDDRGHPGNDLIELALVIAVAVFVGYHIDGERAAHDRAQRARTGQQAAEARYQQLFDTNAAPILVISGQGIVLDANPAARALAGGAIAGRAVSEILGGDAAPAAGAVLADGAVLAAGGPGQVIAMPVAGSGVRYYRLNVTEVPTAPERIRQLVLQDVTEDRAEGDRARRFAELLLKVQEEERRRIAHELHDEPLQLLVHLARTIEWLEEDPAALPGGLTGARDQIIDIAARVRSVVAGLRPAALEQLGLVAAVRGFLADVADTTDLSTDLKVCGEQVRLAPDVELGAYRIAQEAANNVVRHANARNLRVTLAFTERELRIRVADDGRGFDPGAADAQLATGHLGMPGMRERATLAGGQLTVTSQPGHGTVIEAVIPIASRSPDT
ncbi:MAG TPA: ATP-binding protein [Trebonia sp.]|nr:ATP-binding protein [Trebonia sp.]